MANVDKRFLRKLHGCPPLKFNVDLASSAQAYAEVLASKNVFQHSGSHDVGENLAKQSGLPANFSGHFSQVIWKDTNAMGMGKALSHDGQTAVVVGHYQPPGNFMGEWGQNVPPVLHGEPRPLTLEELAKGMNEDVKSEEKENLVSSKNPVDVRNSAGQTDAGSILLIAEWNVCIKRRLQKLEVDCGMYNTTKADQRNLARARAF
ncbi:hypothetical protein ACTXT7_006184 [Hymenolepis weldensis]